MPAASSRGHQSAALRYDRSHETGKIEILCPAGKARCLLKDHQAKAQNDQGRVFWVKLHADQCQRARKI